MQSWRAYTAILTYFTTSRGARADRYMDAESLDDVKAFAKRKTVRRIVLQECTYTDGRRTVEAEWRWESFQGRP